MSETWTTAQAAMIIDKPLDLFEKSVERAPVPIKRLRRGGRNLRVFEIGDLVFFCALDELKRDLTPERQFEAYEALKRVPRDGSFDSVEIGRLKYDFDPFLKAIRSKIEAVGQLHDLIDESGPEPVIKGTSIEAYRIAALCDGMALADILRDYPSLNEKQIAAAKSFARANPKVGRPYPKMTAKQAMRRQRVPDVGELVPNRG